MPQRVFECVREYLNVCNEERKTIREHMCQKSIHGLRTCV